MSKLDPRVFHFQEEIHMRPNNPSLSSNFVKGSMNLFKGGPLNVNRYKPSSLNRSAIQNIQRKEYLDSKAEFQNQLGQKYAQFLYRYNDKQRSKSQLSNYGSSTLLSSHHQVPRTDSGFISDKDKYYFQKKKILRKQFMKPKDGHQKYNESLFAGRYTVQQIKYANKTEERDYNYSHIRSGFRPNMLKHCDDMKGILG